MNLTPPEGALACPLGSFWFTPDHLLYFGMNHAVMSVDKLKESVGIMKQLIGNKPVSLLVEVTNVTPLDNEMMNYIAPELPGLFNAMAIISNSQLATLVANTFLHFKKLPFPTRLFNTEKEAREWLLQIHHTGESESKPPLHT
jgi:hypothetical protein